MQFGSEEVLQAQVIAAVKSKRAPSKWLVLGAGKSAFFSAGDFAGKLQEALSNRDKRAVIVESSDVAAHSPTLVRKLARLIQECDAVQLIYDGTRPFHKSILPAAIMARFLGKGVVLWYYPNTVDEKIPRSHRMILKLCQDVYVSSRYFQSDLAKQKINSEVVLPPVNIESWPVRTIDQVQPQIMLNQSDTAEAGIICAMKAVGMVKQKYPRTELLLRIENFETADIFINCSQSETVPWALLAAMATGLPCISVESYGAREVIENGVNGLLIRQNDHSQLADKIIKLVEEPVLAARISKEAVRIRARLSMDNLVRRLP